MTQEEWDKMSDYEQNEYLIKKYEKLLDQMAEWD